MPSNESKIIGYVKNKCRCCRQIFKLPYFEDETPEVAEKTVCFLCMFGLKNYEELEQKLTATTLKSVESI